MASGHWSWHAAVSMACCSFQRCVSQMQAVLTRSSHCPGDHGSLCLLWGWAACAATGGRCTLWPQSSPLSFMPPASRMTHKCLPPAHIFIVSPWTCI